MRKLEALKGFTKLSNTQQRSISGGNDPSCDGLSCRWGCCNGYCLPYGQAGLECSPAPSGGNE